MVGETTRPRSRLVLRSLSSRSSGPLLAGRAAEPLGSRLRMPKRPPSLDAPPQVCPGCPSRATPVITYHGPRPRHRVSVVVSAGRSARSNVHSRLPALDLWNVSRSVCAPLPRPALLAVLAGRRLLRLLRPCLIASHRIASHGMARCGARPAGVWPCLAPGPPLAPSLSPSSHPPWWPQTSTPSYSRCVELSAATSHKLPKRSRRVASRRMASQAIQCTR